ncbi:unnamed protein product [Cyprideis torosa]|uniref:Uncharacterized protein n=1 Tax=Cyprideis torosa TaxID=163714 RepID=A0A7R8WSV0_9CRUS|nr:unnamed protein product [Cyprideis torosa]CAG0904185.1 unnamed protein product [Cyprideis torosa]
MIGLGNHTVSVDHQNHFEVQDDSADAILVVNEEDRSSPDSSTGDPSLDEIGVIEGDSTSSSENLDGGNRSHSSEERGERLRRIVSLLQESESGDEGGEGQDDDEEEEDRPSVRRVLVGSRRQQQEDEITKIDVSFLDKEHLPTHFNIARSVTERRLGIRSVLIRNKKVRAGSTNASYPLYMRRSKRGILQTWGDSMAYDFWSSVRTAKRFELFAKLEEHDGCVNALNFSPDGTYIVSGSDDLKVNLWSWAQRKLVKSLDSGHHANVFQTKFVMFSRNGPTHIATCARDGHVRLLELDSTGEFRSNTLLVRHRSVAHKLATLVDEPTQLLSCSEDGTVNVIDLRSSQTTKHKIKTGSNARGGRLIPLYSIASNPFNSREFVVSGRDPTVRIYDLRNMGGGPKQKFVCEVAQAGRMNVSCAVYNWNGSEVLATYNDGDIYAWSCKGGEKMKFQGHRNDATVKGVNYFGPRSEFVVSGSDDGHVWLWERKSGAVLNTLYADEAGVVNVLEPHPSVPILATSGLDHDVKVWLPSGDKDPDSSTARRLARSNLRDRENSATNEPDNVDFFQHLMHLMSSRPLRTGTLEFALSRRVHDEDSDSEEEHARVQNNSTSSEDDDDDRTGQQCIAS